MASGRKPPLVFTCIYLSCGHPTLTSLMLAFVFQPVYCCISCLQGIPLLKSAHGIPRLPPCYRPAATLLPSAQSSLGDLNLGEFRSFTHLSYIGCLARFSTTCGSESQALPGLMALRLPFSLSALSKANACHILQSVSTVYTASRSLAARVSSAGGHYLPSPVTCASVSVRPVTLLAY